MYVFKPNMYRELQTLNKTLVEDGQSKLGASILQDISGQRCYLQQRNTFI
jgi:hypothetical protein